MHGGYSRPRRAPGIMGLDLVQRRFRAVAATVGFAITTGLICGGPAFAGQRHGVNLAELSIEELLAIRVVSGSKKSQPVTETAAAIYVITADDIRRQSA